MHAIVKHYNLSKQAANFSLSRSVLSNLTTMLPLLKLFCTFCIEFVIYELAATTVHVPYMAFIKQFKNRTPIFNLFYPCFTSIFKLFYPCFMSILRLFFSLLSKVFPTYPDFIYILCLF